MLSVEYTLRLVVVQFSKIRLVVLCTYAGMRRLCKAGTDFRKSNIIPFHYALMKTGSFIPMNCQENYYSNYCLFRKQSKNYSFLQCLSMILLHYILPLCLLL